MCLRTHRPQVRQEGNADAKVLYPWHLGPFPGRLQGEENKEWDRKTSLQNSLRSLLKVPSLSCLTFFTKLQISRLRDLSGNRKKDQENGKSLSSGQSRLESKVYHALLLLASPGSSSSPHKALSSSCINIRPDVMK